MIKREEYKMLSDIEKNNVSAKLLDYAVTPEVLIRMHETKVLEGIGKYSLNPEADYPPEFRKDLKIISRLLDRELIEIHDRAISSIGELMIAKLFRLKSRGYDAIMEYRKQYMFWIPIGISIIGAGTGIASLLITLCAR